MDKLTEFDLEHIEDMARREVENFYEHSDVGWLLLKAIPLLVAKIREQNAKTTQEAGPG